jgi:hypothetical protein
MDVDAAVMVEIKVQHQLSQHQNQQLLQQQRLQQQQQIVTEAAAQVVHAEDHVLFGGCAQDHVLQHAVIMDVAIQIQLLHLNHLLIAAHVLYAFHGRHVNHVDA